jgi:serine/threonine protein kinase
MFSRERDALEMVRCGHPHLIDFLGSGSSGGRFGILMSPVADMDLDRFLRDYSQGIFLWARIDLMSVRATQRKMFGSSLLDSSPKKWVTSLLEQMRGLASAISHIHDMKPHVKWRRHGDIKPSNILVLKQRDGWNFRLTDLGCASFAATVSTERSKPLAVTPMYCAPECYKYTNQIRQPDRSIDIWSLGCVYLEILTWTLGIPIEDFENFRSPDPNDRAFCSKQDRVKLWLDKLRERAKYKEFSFPYHRLFDTISKMMSNNPDDRPTAKEVHSAFPPNSCVDVPGEGSDVTADSQLPSGTQGIDRTLRSDDTARKHVIGSGKRTILRHNVRLLINGRPVDAVPDTGSDQNVISSSLAFQLNLVIDPGHKDLPSFQLADGTEVQPIGTVELDWALVRLPEKTFSSVFYVMKDISTVVLSWPTLDKLQLFTINQHLMETRPANTDSPPRCLQLSSLTPTLKCNIASRPVIAILDTGCDVDLVSHEFVLRRRLILKKTES